MRNTLLTHQNSIWKGIPTEWQRAYSSLLPILTDKKTRRIDEEWYADKLVKYCEYFSCIGLREEVSVPDSCECRRGEIYRVEIPPPFYEVIKKHPDDEYQYDYSDLYFEFLTERETRVELTEGFLEEEFRHFL